MNEREQKRWKQVIRRLSGGIVNPEEMRLFETFAEEILRCGEALGMEVSPSCGEEFFKAVLAFQREWNAVHHETVSE